MDGYFSARNLKSYIEVTKPKTVFLLAYVGFAAGIVGAKDLSSLEASLPATLAVILASMGANAVTCYIDRDIDALMVRTMRRPLPMGRIKPPQRALYLGALLILASFAILLVKGFLYSVLWASLGLFLNVITYNSYLKRRNPVNVIVGSPAGGTPIMGVWSAVTGEIASITPVLMAALVVLWTPIHIWSLAVRYIDDYRKAKVPMLPVVIGVKPAIRCIAATSILLTLFSSWLTFTVILNPLLYLAPLTALNAALIAFSLKLLLKPSEAVAWRLFKLTSPYLFVVFTLMALTA